MTTKKNSAEKTKALDFIKRFHELVREADTKMDLKDDHATARKHMGKVRELAAALSCFNIGFTDPAVVVDVHGRFIGLVNERDDFNEGDFLEVVTKLHESAEEYAGDYIEPVHTDYPVFVRFEARIHFCGNGLGVVAKRLGGK